jgi:hypothetical protein
MILSREENYSMRQQTILAPDKKAVAQLFPQEIPLSQMVIEKTAAGKNAHIGLVNWWRELPAESQGPTALLTVSAITFLTTSLSALVLARLLKKKE